MVVSMDDIREREDQREIRDAGGAMVRDLVWGGKGGGKERDWFICYRGLGVEAKVMFNGKWKI